MIYIYIQEQDEIEKKNEEKRVKRILDNWAKLIKGLIIRERVAAKYGFKKNDLKKRKMKDESVVSSEDEEACSAGTSAKLLSGNTVQSTGSKAKTQNKAKKPRFGM